ncbi:MAG: hypothetical protein RI883_1729 [Bacteroidota bacterium]|jgi:ligand-binding sensor domain-containing protein
MQKIKAQEPYSKHFTVPSGLPSNSVYALLEDKDGFIWFTCDEGLYRYDGVHFESYRAANQNSFSGSGLMQDKTGRIWYQNFDGNSFYTEKGILKALAPGIKSHYFPMHSTDKYIFYLENNQLIVVDIHTLERLKTFSVNPLSSTSTVFHNQFYFISESELYTITSDLRIKKVTDLNLNIEDYPILFSDDQSIYLTKKSSSENGIWMINSKGQKQICTYNNELVVQNAKVIKDEIYLQTTKGVIVFSKEGKQKESYFTQRNISDILLDRKNNFWFSSTIEGILLVPDLHIYQYTYPNLSPLKILPIDDQLLITTKKEQISFFSPKDNSFTPIYQGQNNAEIYYAFHSKQKNEFVYVMSDGYSYFSSIKSPQNAKKVKFAIKQIVTLDAKYNAFVSSGIIGFYHSKDQNSIKSPFDRFIQGLSKRVENDLIFYEIDPRDRTVRGKAVEYNVKSRTIYFATNSGLFIWKNGHMKELKNNQNSYILRDLFQWNDAVFGFGSDGKMIHLFSQKEHAVSNYTSLLQNENIKQVEVFDNKLIVRNNHFLKVYTINLKGKSILDAKFDISNLECNDFTLLGNTFWIVTANGLIKWDMSKKYDKQNSGLFVLTGFSINDQLEETLNKKLNYDQNNIRIDFALLDYGIKTIESISYQINNQSWKLIDPSERTLNFASLSPGNYTIRFKGLVKGKNVLFKSIHFEIKPPFWSTAWFLSILFVGILILSILYYTYQIRTIRTRNTLVNEKLMLESDLNKSLLSSIKSQMNPHFIFNALNTIQAYIFINDKQNATCYLSKFSKLTRAILEMSDKDEVFLSEELSALRLYLDLEKIRFQDDFQYEINTHSLNIDSIKIPSMLIQPYVENAVKHGLLHATGEKKVSITIQQIEKQLFVEIDDNGIGRKRAEELRIQRDKFHEGFSTQANEKRLRLLSHNTQVVVKYIDKIDVNGQATGTTVQLMIQLKK